jgi:hypothetical protein
MEILQDIAIGIEVVIAGVALLIALIRKKSYGWLLALTFILYVAFDLARSLEVELFVGFANMIFLIATLSALFALIGIYKDKKESEE